MIDNNLEDLILTLKFAEKTDDRIFIVGDKTKAKILAEYISVATPCVATHLDTDSYIQAFKKVKGYRNVVIIVDDIWNTSELLDFVNYLNNEDIFNYVITERGNNPLAKSARMSVIQSVDKIIERIKP